MTATISLVESTQPETVTAAAGRMGTSIAALDDQIAAQQRELATLRVGWQGAAADAAITKAEQNLNRQRDMHSRLLSVQSVLNAGGTNMGAMRAQVISLAAQARSLGALVSDDGTVSSTGHHPLLNPNVAAAYSNSLHALLNQFDAVDEATVAWLGYEPPSNLAEAALPGYADDAAPKLASFVNGLDSSRTTDPNLTVIGHSYGSLVASEALQRGTAADNVVFAGSPGIESNVMQYFHETTPAELHLSEGHVFVEHAQDDVVADLGRFGGLKVEALPGFTQLSTELASTPLGPTTASSGHSEYSLPDTTALYNQAVVIAGLGTNDDYVRKVD